MPDSRSILVVEDEPLIAMLVADWLAELGCEVIGPVARASEAIPHIEAQRLTAVLLDVSLGPEDSFSVADLAVSKGIPIAFVTGRAVGDLPNRFKDVRLLPKPFEFDDVRTLVADLIGAPPGTPSGKVA
jgi:CheY-like chemotaxis protein